MKKKILALFLAAVLIVSCVFPVGALGKKILFPQNLHFDDYPKYLQTEIYSLDDIWNLEKSSAALQAMKDFKPDQLSVFFSGLSTLSSGISTINGIFAFLKMTGIIEDPTTKMLRSIQESIADIMDAVNEVNYKMDDIISTLNAEFSKIDMEFNFQRYETFQSAWTQFFTQGAVKDLDELTDAYESQNNTLMLKYAKKWQAGSKTGVRALYDADSMLLYAGDNIPESGLKLPEAPEYSSDGTPIKVEKSITLPADYIEVADVRLTANNYTKYIRKAFEQGVINAANAGDLIADDAFYTEWKDLSDAGKKVKATEVADDLFDSFCYAVSHSIANQSDAGHGTFASQFKAAFDSYCQTIQGANAITSPITAALEKLTLTHTFEGEIVQDFGDITTMLATQTMEYGMLATFLTELDDSMLRSEKNSVVENNKKTYNVVLGSYDMFITGYDNYCYPLNGLLEYRDAYLLTEYEATNTGTKSAKLTQTIPWTVVDSTNYNVAASKEDRLKAVDEMKGLLSLRDVSLLYYYYQNSGFYGDFFSFLEDNDAVKAVKFGNDEYNTNIITSGFTINSFKDDKSVTMPRYVYGYSTKALTSGGKLTIDRDDERHDVMRNEVIGTIFNIAAGQAGAGTTDDVKGRTVLNAKLGRAMFGSFQYGYLDRNDAYHVDYYGTHVATDGEFFKSCSIESSNIAGTDTGSAFKSATYTASTGYNYGALVIVPMPEAESDDVTASIFGNGNIALIAGGAVLICAIGFGCGFAVGGKRKAKKADK